jgi:hypothetical protein
LRIRADQFTGGIAALPDGGFLIAAQSLGDWYEIKAGGVMRVSADSIVTPVLCASSAYLRTRAEGRDLYLSGRAVTDALTDFPPSDLAVTPDGSIVLNYVTATPRFVCSPRPAARSASPLRWRPARSCPCSAAG